MAKRAERSFRSLEKRDFVLLTSRRRSADEQKASDGLPVTHLPQHLLEAVEQN